VITVADMTPIELAGFVGSHLSKQGINVVLSGGICVAYYSKGKYVSMDLDFVNASFAKRDKIKTAMAEIGFNEDNRYFRHPDTEYLVEFPPGPLGVGDEQVGEIVEIKTRTGTFKIISPTDCVKDRLAGYYHWDDMPCLEQAVLVACENQINIKEIERWSKKEGKGDKFEQFQGRLKRKA
jgi:hypothetical protein